MPRRNRRGGWQHVASFSQHNGRVNEHNLPTVANPGDWRVVVREYPCEVLSTSGGETIRGRQVTAYTTHVLFGDYFAARNIKPDMRVKVKGMKLNIVSVLDPDGDQFEMRIECKAET